MGSFLCGGSFGMPVVSASGLDAMLWNPKISSIRSDHLAKPSLEPLFSWNFPNFPRLGPLVSRVWGKVYRTPVFFFSDFYTQVSTDFVRHKKTWLRRREKIRWKPGWQWLIIIFPHIFYMKKMLVFGCFWLISCYILFLGSISPGEVAAALESHQLAGKVPCCHGDGLMWHDFCYVAIEHGHRNSWFTRSKWWCSTAMLVYRRV